LEFQQVLGYAFERNGEDNKAGKMDGMLAAWEWLFGSTRSSQRQGDLQLQRQH